jgi:hypothetical protein
MKLYKIIIQKNNWTVNACENTTPIFVQIVNLRVSIVNLEVGHRFILEQSIGHMGKQRSTNRDLNSI